MQFLCEELCLLLSDSECWGKGADYGFIIPRSTMGS
jgi:hypothetical protein